MTSGGYAIDVTISIHSLVKRETYFGDKIQTAASNFNPLPRKEGDAIDTLDGKSASISIHSLVKRETIMKRYGKNFLKNFNPLPRKEGDGRYAFLFCVTSNFNPLPRKEGDRTSKELHEEPHKFQSTPS